MRPRPAYPSDNQNKLDYDRTSADILTRTGDFLVPWLLSQNHFPKEKKCRKNHWNQWRKDTITICKNMIQASKKMESALKNAAITVLRNNGWKFKGFDQP